MQIEKTTTNSAPRNFTALFPFKNALSREESISFGLLIVYIIAKKNKSRQTTQYKKHITGCWSHVYKKEHVFTF